MTAPTLRHLSYTWRGRQERITAIGEGTPVLFLTPFLEEANRTRHFLVETMRDLAARGHRCFLPDLPGTLESLARLDALGWDDWTGATAAALNAAAGSAHVAAFRGGALLDSLGGARSRWRFVPVDGAGLLRDLVRVRVAADREAGTPMPAAEVERLATTQGLDVAGYRLAPGFLSAMKISAAEVGAKIRTVRLETDAQPADARYPGQPLWRRSEPGHDAALCRFLADDIARWIESCGAG